MYPAGDLTRLDVRKARIRARIERDRETCVAACHNLAAPVERLERWRDRLHRFGPYVPWTLAALALSRRSARPKRSAAATALRWAPLVFRGIKLVSGLGL